MEQGHFFQKCGKWIASVLPHLLMAYSWMLLTFFVINCLNPAMSFLDSKISQQFELVYAAAALLCAVSGLIGKHLRILGVLAAVVAIAFVIPVFPAMAHQSNESLDTVYFRVMACVASVTTLVYSIADIVVMRLRAKANAA